MTAPNLSASHLTITMTSPVSWNDQLMDVTRDFPVRFGIDRPFSMQRVGTTDSITLTATASQTIDPFAMADYLRSQSVTLPSGPSLLVDSWQLTSP